MLDVTVLEDYRIRSDGTAYTVFKLKEIDPTKSPSFKEGASTEKYKKWDSLGKYASTVPNAINIIIADCIHNSDAKDIKELRAFVKELRKLLEDVSGAF